MVLVFYPAHADIGRVDYNSVLRLLELDNGDESKKALQYIVSQIDDVSNLHIFDMSVPFTSSCGVGGYADMVEMYNDEDLDGGYWCVSLNLDQETIVEILYPNSEENEEN